MLAALAARPREVVAPGALAEALWAEAPPPSWTKVVQGCVVRLRRSLGADAIVTEPAGYRLGLPADAVDAVRFRRQLARARELQALGQYDRVVFHCDEALRLWRGPALPELVGWLPGVAEAVRLDELRMDAEELRLEAMLATGAAREALGDALVAAAAEPLRERRWGILAQVQYALGRQGDALATLRRARTTLAEELGVDPGFELTALERGILRQAPGLEPVLDVAVGNGCPYPGLAPYGREHADGFFGREDDVAAALARLDGCGVLAVAGPSGSGKSSLVVAGVVPVLERRGRRVVVMAPGRDPSAVLAGCGLREDDVLVVDQAEEVMTLCLDHATRVSFLDALVDHARGAPLVLVVRADGLGGLAEHAGIAELVERGFHLLTPMSAAQLRDAVERPARQVGLRLEPGLVALLLRDIEGEPGALPLLAHALRQTWERREGRTLTVDGYRATGGIQGAVAQSAERVHAEAGSNERQVLRELFLRLVDTTSGGDPVRTRVPRAALAGDEVSVALLDRLVRERLVTIGDGTVELAHEALLRAWPRLQAWLAEDADGQALRRHLTAAATTWDSMGRPHSELFRGVRLARSTEWRARADPTLSAVERAFLDASRHAEEAEQAAALAATLRQARENRRLRSLVAVTVTLAVVAALGGVAAIREARRADGEARLARAHELAASAITVLDEDPSLASLLAVTAATTGPPSRQTTAALHRVLSADRSVARYRLASDAGVPWADLHPDGDVMVVAGTTPVDASGPVVEVVDPRTDEVRWQWDVWAEWGTDAAFVAAPRFTHGGRTVVVGAFWDTANVRRAPVPIGPPAPPAGLVGLHLRHGSTGRPAGRIDVGRCGAHLQDVGGDHALVRVVVGPAAALAACDWAHARTAVELVDLRTGGVRRVLEHEPGHPWFVGAALDDAGEVVAYDDPVGRQITVRSTSTGDELARVAGHGVRDLDAEARVLLLDTSPPRVVDVRSGAIIAQLAVGADPIRFARFDDESRSLLTTGADGVLRVWSMETGLQLEAIPAVGDGPVSVAGPLAVVSRPDRETVTLLDLGRDGETGHLVTCPGEALSDTLSFVDDGFVAGVRCADDALGTTWRIGTVAGGERTSVGGLVGVAMSVSPDGDAVVRWESHGEGPVVMRLSDGSVQTRLEDPRIASMGAATRLRWSPDSTRVAAALGRKVAVWEAKSGTLLAVVDVARPDGSVADVLFDLAGHRLIVSDTARVLHAVSTTSWEVVQTRDVGTDGAYRIGLLGQTPDGSSLVTAGPYQAAGAGSLSWFDPDTLELQHTLANVHAGGIVAAAWSPDRRQLATASSDRSVRVWDSVTGEPIHELPIDGDPVGVAFTSATDLGVLLDDGTVELATIDDDRLRRMATERLTRGYSVAECERFGFGEVCPTLAELGTRPPRPGGDVLVGTWRLEWTTEALVDAVRAAVSEIAGRPVSVLSPAVSGWTADHAGVYDITFVDGRFEVLRSNTPDVWCAGTYEFQEQRLHLRSERGWWCYEVRLFSANARVEGDQLVIEAEGFRGTAPDVVLFASRPWNRID